MGDVQSTVSHRVTIGKSAIHGFGLIAKRRLEEGEMVSARVLLINTTQDYTSRCIGLSSIPEHSCDPSPML